MKGLGTSVVKQNYDSYGGEYLRQNSLSYGKMNFLSQRRFKKNKLLISPDGENQFLQKLLISCNGDYHNGATEND